jgi:hypothetical protein
MPQHASICPTATACGVSPSLLRQLSSPSPIGSSLVEIRELLKPLSLLKDCDRPFVSQHVDEVRQLRVEVVKGRSKSGATSDAAGRSAAASSTNQMEHVWTSRTLKHKVGLAGLTGRRPVVVLVRVDLKCGSCHRWALLRCSKWIEPVLPNPDRSQREER